MAMGETVLYYHPEGKPPSSRMTGVLFRMKIRIRKVGLEEIRETVGFLAGMKGFEKRDATAFSEQDAATPEPDERGDGPAGAPLAIEDEMLVLSNISSSRLNELLAQFKRAGVPRINLKAMVTPTNCKWSFYELYREIKEEHEALSRQEPGN